MFLNRFDCIRIGSRLKGQFKRLLAGESEQNILSADVPKSNAFIGRRSGREQGHNWALSSFAENVSKRFLVDEIECEKRPPYILLPLSRAVRLIGSGPWSYDGRFALPVFAGRSQRVPDALLGFPIARNLTRKNLQYKS